MNYTVSVVIPAKNEYQGLKSLLPELCEGNRYHEIIVVDDGSTDNSGNLCSDYPVRLVSHKYTMGNGAAVKSGIRAASGEVLVFMDGDGQHDPGDIDTLLQSINEGYDMAVGTRTRASHAGKLRWLANQIYNTFASWVTGHKVVDLTSGFRAIRAGKLRQFLFMLPNGFSYPATITMAFFRSGYSVAYVPVNVRQRIGKSHIRMLYDGIRFLLIIFKVGTLYSPLKIFAPASVFLFLVGCSYYIYTFFTQGRFTNMGMLILITAFLLFFVGLISEQLTVLLYSNSRDRQD